MRRAAPPQVSRRRRSLALIRVALGLLLLVGLAVLPGCSIKKMVAGNVANSLTQGDDVFGTDDDPELIRDALPFGIKLLESVLAMVPKHEGLLLTLARGYTQYSFAFVQMDANAMATTDFARAEELRGRALKLYLRARDYGLRALELRHEGIGARLKTDPDGALAVCRKQDVPAMYWTAAGWGSAISVGKDRPALVADVSTIRALMARALVLDETYDLGALHEAMIVLESLPAIMGGSPERARRHFDRAIELSRGDRATPFVLVAENLSIPSQDRADFDQLLQKALAIDPNKIPRFRLETLLIQRRARELEGQADDVFIGAEPDSMSTQDSK